MSILRRLFGNSSAANSDYIEAEVLQDQLRSATPPILVDVRGPGEFAGPLGHISGARNIPLDQIPAKAAELAKEKQPIVLVCHSDRRSSMAAKMLQRAGISSVSVLRGGMAAWRAGNR
ncbi:MAG TPA: rhodanese-like domain-containing protein [Rhodopila sp.]|nr:rhodanese-like domain-containing protein [Rhodopila sp.]